GAAAPRADDRVEREQKARREAFGIVSPGKMLRAEDFEAAVIEQRCEIGGAEVQQLARDVDALPFIAEKQELPAGGVRDLHDQAAVRREQAIGGIEKADRIVEMLQDVEHRDGRAASVGKRSTGESSANGGDAMEAPGGAGGVERKIEPDGGAMAAGGQNT